MSDDVLRRLEENLARMLARNEMRQKKIEEARRARQDLHEERSARAQALAELADIRSELLIAERELARCEDRLRDAEIRAEKTEKEADRAREDVEPTIDLEIKVKQYRLSINKTVDP